ncbi:MAG: hypothetical protein IPP71_03570 [Bacteroidetes bacterium]|nr:hypothetical protein [Bacteroidota bacterium]
MVEKKSKPAEIKTKQNSASVEEFIGTVKNEQKQQDSFTLLAIMKQATGEEPKMWEALLLVLK